MDYRRLGAVLFLAFNCAACSALNTARPDISAPQAAPPPPSMAAAAEPDAPPPIPPEYGPEAAELLSRMPDPYLMIETGRGIATEFTNENTYAASPDPENARASFLVYAATGLEMMGIGYARLGEAPPPEDRALFTAVQRELQSVENRFYKTITKDDYDEAAILMFANCSSAAQIDKATDVLQSNGVRLALDMDYPAAVKARCNSAVAAVVGEVYMQVADHMTQALRRPSTQAEKARDIEELRRTYSFP